MDGWHLALVSLLFPGLGPLYKHLRIAREVDFPEDRVLNVTPRRLLDFLEMRSGKSIAELADF
ncbi:histidinol-phosphatase [Pantoea eucalypti]|jgi:putative hydrolase|uniref:Histidinol-phosphatase n=1 Tax=Pantoea eucalypti TaxID=470933 RepID=A0ABY2ZC72_9GAMM|nr:histidinol-phosphatase [Pantoea eucalypti]TPV30862.1 histidinol-phosphatase [Pantoea eucalypti]